jgi:protein-tyrosine-phosphatase
MPSVLFVCTANQFRSPLAAALFRNALQQNDVIDPWTVGSAGTWASDGLPVITAVSAFARTCGLDLNRHRSVEVNREMLSAHDLILVMEAGHKEALQNEFPFCRDRVFLLSQVAEDRIYDIPDSMESVEAVNEVCANLDELIRTGFDNICNLAVNIQKTEGTS